jgi:hypothetical protein
MVFYAVKQCSGLQSPLHSIREIRNSTILLAFFYFSPNLINKSFISSGAAANPG